MLRVTQRKPKMLSEESKSQEELKGDKERTKVQIRKNGMTMRRLREETQWLRDADN